MCSTDGNRSYPIDPPSSLNSDMYESVRDTFSIEFHLGQRASAPIFANTLKALVDEGKGSTPPTIQYNGLSYKIIQAQVTRPYNSKWIVSAVKKAKNTADLTLVFQTTISTADKKYIFISIPLLRETNYANDPLYLQALSGSPVQGPFSLSQCMTNDYAVYSTCLEPKQLNALVLVFYQGCSVSSTTLDALVRRSTALVAFNPPTDVTLTTTPHTLTTDVFNTSVIVSTLSQIQQGTSSVKVTSTNAYTCVPLDPDRDVKNGKLNIDTSTGLTKPMNTILAERVSAKGPMAPGELEMAIAIFLGILISLGGFFGIIYFYITYQGQVDLSTAWYKDVPANVFIAVLFCFAGFLIGALTR